MITNFQDKTPKISPNVFIAPDAWVIGAVTIGKNCSILFGAVIRGDLEPIIIGNNSNIQDHSIIHTSKGKVPTTIGSYVSVGHRVTLHSCTIKDRALIGMGAIVLDEAVISEDSLVGAGSLVTQGKTFPPRSLIIGSPARVIRELTDEEVAHNKLIAERYVGVGKSYCEELKTDGS